MTTCRSAAIESHGARLACGGQLVQVHMRERDTGRVRALAHRESAVALSRYLPLLLCPCPHPPLLTASRAGRLQPPPFPGQSSAMQNSADPPPGSSL